MSTGIDTQYAVTQDGVYLCYQTLGEGPIDFVWQSDWPGNIDFDWDDPLLGPWIREIATYGRLITHDHRGIGLSSRNVQLPDIETRAADLGVVLRAVGCEQPVLMGLMTSGAVHALYAAMNPSKVRAIVWIEPSARTLWSPDYPWGMGPDYHSGEQPVVRLWGTTGYGRAHLEHETAFGNEMPLVQDEMDFASKQSRNVCTPDVAMKLNDIWYATDVRAILPAVRCPTLLLRRGGTDPGESEYIASQMPDAKIAEFPGGAWSDAVLAAQLPLIREFVGIDNPSHAPDAKLAAVLFTDIVGSTEKHASLGDAVWKDLLESHHAAVRTHIDRWQGTEVDTAGDGFYATFEGPVKAVRCAQEISDAVHDLGLEIRAGVHVGECTIIDGKMGGLPVTIGARISAAAGPSEILVSQIVKDLVPGSGLAFADAGEHELKGIPDRWHLYRVVS